MARGDITWHAFPFNGQAELFDADLFEEAVALTHDLDERFGLPHKRTMSQVRVSQDCFCLFVGMGTLPPKTCTIMPSTMQRSTAQHSAPFSVAHLLTHITPPTHTHHPTPPSYCRGMFRGSHAP